MTFTMPWMVISWVTHVLYTHEERQGEKRPWSTEVFITIRMVSRLMVCTGHTQSVWPPLLTVGLWFIEVMFSLSLENAWEGFFFQCVVVLWVLQTSVLNVNVFLLFAQVSEMDETAPPPPLERKLLVLHLKAQCKISQATLNVKNPTQGSKLTHTHTHTRVSTAKTLSLHFPILFSFPRGKPGAVISHIDRGPSPRAHLTPGQRHEQESDLFCMLFLGGGSLRRKLSWGWRELANSTHTGETAYLITWSLGWSHDHWAFLLCGDRDRQGATGLFTTGPVTSSCRPTAWAQGFDSRRHFWLLLWQNITLNKVFMTQLFTAV